LKLGCFLDNRYADDAHWKGGCVVASEMLHWASVMFSWNARAPNPKGYAGDDWKGDWKKRLESATSWNKTWLEHQNYDDYWRHGSICEDWGKVQIPVLAIGGWRDMYSNAVLRMVDQLPNCRGIMGPWSHDWPDVSIPGPQVRKDMPYKT
jgi:predicted acyl esterase